MTTTRAPEIKASRQNERGNAFFYILLGVILFAALAFMLSRGMRGQTTNNMSKRQVELAATDIINYAQKVSHAVDRLRRKGCSENDISFYIAGNTELAQYKHTPEASDECKVFHPDGGNVEYQKKIDSKWNVGNIKFYTGTQAMTGVGTDDSPDLYFRLTFDGGISNYAICTEINKRLDIKKTGSGPNSDSFIPYQDGLWASSAFIGSFTDPAASTLSHTSLNGKNAYCAGHNTLAVSYYLVLLAR